MQNTFYILSSIKNAFRKFTENASILNIATCLYCKNDIKFTYKAYIYINVDINPSSLHSKIPPNKQGGTNEEQKFIRR